MLWRFRLSLIILLAAAATPYAQADQTAHHPGTFAGTAVYDHSADSGEMPFYWCRERLWLNGEKEDFLVDPASGLTVATPPLLEDKARSRFFGCSSDGGAATVALIDNLQRGISWMTLDGKRGDIAGVARGGGSTMIYPLIDFDDNVLLAITEGGQVAALDLPAGYRLMRIEPQFLKSTVDLDKVILLIRIGPGLFTLRLSDDDQILLEIDTAGPEPRLTGHWRLSELLPLGRDDFVGSPEQDGAGLQIKVWRKSDFTGLYGAVTPVRKICRVRGLGASPAKAECHQASATEQPLDDRISANLPNSSLLISPSGRWTAWAEENKDDIHTVRVYVAPTASLPQ